MARSGLGLEGDVCGVQVVMLSLLMYLYFCEMERRVFLSNDGNEIGNE